MKQELKLHHPVLIDGKTVDVLSYDVDEITPVLFAQADARKMQASTARTGNLSGAAELDFSLHLYLGIAAVIAINPGYDVADLERVKGRDAVALMRIGRDFFGRSEESEDDSSAEPSATTPEPSTPQPRTSKKDA